MTSLFRLAVLLGAALLFFAEPIAARQLLPLYGGAAAVWITCLVFFQAALLAGYAYAHLLAGARGRWARYVHFALLAAAVASAFSWATASPAADPGGPVTGILLRLVAWLGLPFVALAATSPLVQVWQRRTTGGRIPYSLYGWSNAASLLALLSYPTLVEPALPLPTQKLCWAFGVAVFAAVSAALAWRVPASTKPLASPLAIQPGQDLVLCFLLALAGSTQLSAITAHITGNVAAIPLLWIVPLAVYLLTFIVAFQDRVRIPRTPLAGVTAVLLIAAGNFLSKPQFALPIGLGLGLFLAELAAACLFCHSEVYRLRPLGDADATAFYLALAAGGATGALLIGVAAPAVFRANYDLSLTLAVTAAAGLAAVWPQGPRPRLVWSAAIAILLILAVQLHQAYGTGTLMSERNFYGSLRVTRGMAVGGASGPLQVRTLLYGTITHGTEIFSVRGQGEPRVPTAYYAPDSGIGLALLNCCGDRPRRIGVVGLGVGTLAAYGHAGDQLRFYEINPAVQPIAQNLFSYLSQTAASVTLTEGDGRALLAQQPREAFDVLVLDAFSGDAIPLHLLTVEAIQVYKRQLAPEGILAFHVSNQYVDLEPELQALAAATGLETLAVSSEANEDSGAFKADWVLMHDPRTARPAALGQHAHPLRQQPGIKPWTDDYSSLLRLVRW